MNTDFTRHFPEDVLEKYAMGKLSDEENAPVEEHLLICGICQQVLSKLDEYLDVVRAALAENDSASASQSFDAVKKPVCSAGRR
jgi:uncharacterized CHY-type Zn-finger protein